MKIILALLLTLFLTTVMFAATNAPVTGTSPFDTSINAPVHVLPKDTVRPNDLTLLIAIGVPALIAGLKSWLPKMPSWILPILAPALGALSDYVMQLSGVSTNGVAVGALLGSAGVGLRELHDQLKQKIGPDAPPTTAPPPPPVVPPVATPPPTP